MTLLKHTISYVTLSFLFIVSTGCSDGSSSEGEQEYESTSLSQEFMPPKINTQESTLPPSFTPPSIN